MLITEIVTMDGRQFVYNHSNEGFFIERDGILYAEAYDPIAFQNERIYTETNVKMEEVDSEENVKVIEEENKEENKEEVEAE